jgi:phosphoribosyl-ATP pyrophosphohydrolase
MAEEKAYQLGKKLGEKADEVTPEAKQKAEEALAWSRSQAVPSDENHRAVVEKG